VERKTMEKEPLDNLYFAINMKFLMEELHLFHSRFLVLILKERLLISPNLVH
jgi:hypothetical protein